MSLSKKFNPALVTASLSALTIAGCTDQYDNGYNYVDNIDDKQYELSEFCGIDIFKLKREIFSSNDNKIRDLKIINEDCDIEVTYMENEYDKKIEVLTLQEFLDLANKAQETVAVEGEASGSWFGPFLMGYLLSPSSQRSSFMSGINSSYRSKSSGNLGFVKSSSRASLAYKTGNKPNIFTKNANGKMVVGTTKSSAFGSRVGSSRSSSYARGSSFGS